MVKAAVCRKDGAETTALRCRAENSEDTSVWVAHGECVVQNEIVDVLRTNSSNEDGFTFIRTSKNVEGFVKSDYIKMMKCAVHRADEAESTMLRCRPENSEKNSVWVKGKVSVAQNEEIDVVRVNSAGEEGWAFVRTHENAEGYLRAAYVGAPSDATLVNNANEPDSAEKSGEPVKIDESRQVSRRTSSRVAAAPPPSVTLHSFYSKAPSKSKFDDDTPPTPSKAKMLADTDKNDDDAVRRSSRVRAPTKFLVKEMEPPSLDKWLQKVESKANEDSENGDDAAADTIARSAVVDEERPLGEYVMKLRSYTAHESALEDMWQLAATIQYFYLFRPHIPFPAVTIPALLSSISCPAPSADETLEKIHECLLKGICGGIGAKLKDHWTRRLFLKVRQFYETHTFDGTNYDDLPPCARLDLLYDLCCWRLDEGPDMGTDAIRDENADIMRYEALGHSADQRTFYFFLDPDVDPIQSLWIFSDSSPVTLAAHIKKYDRPVAPPPSPKPQSKVVKGKKSPGKKSPAKKVIAKPVVIVPCHIQPEYTGCWKLEAKGLDECKTLAASFASSKQPCEVELAEIMETQVIKAAERRLLEQELAKKREARLKRELELSAAAGASRSKRERKKINYSDDAFNILDAAVEVERKGRGRNNIEEEMGGVGASGRPTRSAAKQATQMFKSISAWDKHGGAIIDEAVDGERRKRRGRGSSRSGSDSSAASKDGSESDYSGSSSSSSSSSPSEASDDSDSDTARRRRRRDTAKAAAKAAAAAAVAKKHAKKSKKSHDTHSKRRFSGLPPAPRLKNMYEPCFPSDADLSAIIAAVEDMPLLSSRSENAGLPCFKVARHLNKRGTSGPPADHLPQAELVRDSLLWLHDLQEKFEVSVPSTAPRVGISSFDFGQWCLMESEYFHITPVVRQYIVDFWREKQKEEEQLQQRALAIYLQAVSSPCNSSQSQAKARKQQMQQQPSSSQHDQQEAASPSQNDQKEADSSLGCDEVQSILESSVPDVPVVNAGPSAAAATAASTGHCSDEDDIHVHGSGHNDGRDSIVICEGGDQKDELFDDSVGQSVLDITGDDGDA